MEIKISKENFLKASVLAEKITGKNLNLPILNSILIETEKGRIKIISTNLDIGMEIYSPAKIEKEGKIAVPAKLINNIILNLKENIVEFKKTNENLKILSGESIATLKTNNLDDFPILPKLKKEKSFRFNANTFLNGLKSTVFSASLSNFKPEIASVYIYSDIDNVFFVATDSFRLIEKKFYKKDFFIDENQKEDEKKNKIISLLIPIKSAVETIYILEEIEKQEKTAEIEFNKNEFLIQNNIFKFFSRLTEGIFPDYKQFTPQNFLLEISINTNELNNILKTANILLSRLNDIIIEINIKQKFIEFKTSNQDLGEYYSKINILNLKTNNFLREKIKLTFNLKYIIEGVNRISSEKTIFKINEEGKPVVIQGEKEQDVFYLVMPMKI